MLRYCSYVDNRAQLGRISAPGDADLGSPNPGTISDPTGDGDGLRPTTGKPCSIYPTP